MKKEHVRLAGLLVIALLLVIFAIQNSHEVVISLWFWKFPTSLALALVICLISGFLLSFLYYLPLIRAKNGMIRKRDKDIARLKAGKSVLP